MRKIPFVNEEYYHIYNRGVDKREIFLEEYDYARFLKSLKEFNQEKPVVSLYINDRIRKKDVAAKPLHFSDNDKLVEIISYCLIPNHFHLILKQLKDGGVSEFMKRVSGGYTWFFNYKYKRSGSLFQGTFKAIHIDTNEYLLYLSAYVNGNYKIHKVNDEKWKFCSLNNYGADFFDMNILLNQFKDIDEYKKYIDVVSKEIKEKREGMGRYLLEN